MARRSVWVLMMCLAACGKNDPPRVIETARTRAGARPAPEAAHESAGAAAAPVHQPAAGGEVVSAATVSSCPRTLGGAESVNRVITRECGVVTVVEDYHINNGSLTLEAGSVLAFREGAALNVGYNDSAKLIVHGTEEAPVVMTSAGDPVAGFWKGVRLHSHADRSVIDHLVLEHAGEGGGEALRIDAKDVAVTGSLFRAAKGVGISFGRHGSAKGFSGNRFEHIGRWPISLGAVAAGDIDGENQFPPGSVVHVHGGTITEEVTWRPAGAPYYVSEDVHVEGVEGAPGALYIAAGVEIRFAPEAQLAVGYSSPAVLRVNGVVFAPVVLGAMSEPRPGAWSGVVVQARGEASFSATVFQHGGQRENVGVLRVEGTASVIGCTFRENIGGVALGARAKINVFDGNTFEQNSKGAVILYPNQLDALGPANRYEGDERIELLAGTVEETATWRAQGALVELLGDLQIDGRTVVTVEPGARFAVKDKVAIVVGKRDNATLRLLGTVDRPIEISGLRDDVGTWSGIQLAESSRDSVVQHVRMRNATAGVVVGTEANALVTDLSCASCAGPALVVGCEAKVVSASVESESRDACP